jgi:hypothetical protein
MSVISISGDEPLPLHRRPVALCHRGGAEETHPPVLSGQVRAALPASGDTGIHDSCRLVKKRVF